MNYYVMMDDIFADNPVKGRWHFKGLKYGGDHQFYNPTIEIMEPGSWPITLLQDGVETDFSCMSGSLPIVSEKIRLALAGIPEVKTPYRGTVIEPVEIEGRTTGQRYFIMITEDKLDCVDEDRSELYIWKEDDAPSPDQVGQYGGISNLVIDPAKAEGHNIFRLAKSPTDLLVSQLVKDAIEAVGATGVVFESVMGDRRTIA